MRAHLCLTILVTWGWLGWPGELRGQPAVTASYTGGNLQIVWPVSSNYDSQVETSGSLLSWQRLGPPYAAPLTSGWQTNSFSLSNQFQFFRVRYGYLTNSPVPTTPGVYSLSFVSGRLVRTYRLNIPTNYNVAVATPLAFMLHGHGQTADSFAAQHPDLAQLASGAGMILVFPQSTSNERGTGWANYDAAPGEPYVDDAQFILDLLEHLAAALNVDRQRVFAAGFSNGGQMVHYLGARTTNTFAAYASIGASIGGGQVGTNIVYIPPPAEPVSVLIVNATNDCARPFWGGPNGAGAFQPAAFEAALHWTSNNLCLESPIVVTATNVINASMRPNYADDCPNVNPPPNTPWTNYVTRTTWIGCTSWVEVAFVELSDGGHLWPDAADNVGFDANAEVIEFFRRHCRCDATGATNSLVVPTTPGTSELSYCDQGYWRKFRLMVPALYTGASATPLVFVFHGGQETIEQFTIEHPSLYTKCNTENIFLVMPQATDHPQTDETLWGNKPFARVVDDNAFVTNLLETLDASLNLDRKRIYACGFSGGGSFAHYLGLTTSNLLAAIAPVATMTGWNDPDTGALIVPPPALEALPVLMVRGTLDARRPYGGGVNNTGQLTFSAGDDLTYWTNQNACGALVISNALAANVTQWIYPTCTGTTEVQLIRVGGMPHIWPDQADGFNYNANVAVIDFLLTHARP
jgi:poly(3-hydroxybutyrate) depolymerase